MSSEVIIEKGLDSLQSIGDGHYLAHILCSRGECRVLFNDREHILKAGDCAIFRAGHQAYVSWKSDDFECRVIYASREVIEKSTPATNYGMKGSISLFNEPVMHLTPRQQVILDDDFRQIEERLFRSDHLFHKELMYNKIQTMILDFFDFHASIAGTEVSFNSESELVNRFITMLHNGKYREHREVAYYASVLCVTPKYLSESCRRVSSYPATYWINRFTSLEISRQLRDQTRSLTEISEYFGFSSLAYFSRYVSRHLGESPTSLRGQ